MPFFPPAIPTLKLRKDIWAHFPVCLVKLPTQHDSRDRYAIQWHKKNLSQWSQNISDYTKVAHKRLIVSLQTSDKWDIEEPINNDDLCVVAMRIPDEKVIDSTKLPNIYADQIVLNSIDDLKDYFPVCWKFNNNIAILEFHNTNLRALSQFHNVAESDLKSFVQKTMIPILDSKWKMLPAVRTGEICRVVFTKEHM
jgi:hypothetical protein